MQLIWKVIKWLDIIKDNKMKTILLKDSLFNRTKQGIKNVLKQGVDVFELKKILEILRSSVATSPRIKKIGLAES